MGGVGLVLGLLLAVASKIFAVEVDEKAVAISEVLPGANCGSCGYAGCSAYAGAISSGDAKPNCCSPGGQAVADKIADILGVKAEAVEEKCAIVCCDGKDEVASKKYEYFGEEDCICASKVQGGGAKDVMPCFNQNGEGAIVNSSRGIMCAYKKEGCDEKDFAGAARREAINMKNSLCEAIAERKGRI